MAPSNYPEKYPYPTEVKFRDFVPVKLCGSSNYSKWRKLMLRLIETQELVGFIVGEVVAPAPVDQTIQMPDDATEINRSADCRAWKKSDALLQSWIIGTINEDLFEIVEDLQTARAMWTTLETAFKDFPALTRNAVASSEKHQYPYPVEVKVREFVPIKLSGGSNYYKWRNLMLRLMEAQGLVGFINGEVPAPDKIMEVPYEHSSSTNGTKQQIESQDYKAWRKTDALLQSWIIRTLNEDLLEILENLKTASHMWTTLDRTFKDSQTETNKTDDRYPSEIKVRVFFPTLPMPIKLSRSNYSVWRPMMLTLVKAQGLGGFISGKVLKPPKTITLAADSSRAISGETKMIVNGDYKAWKRLDALLRNWILGSINEDLVTKVVNCKTAEQMWAQLKDEVVYETETESEAEDEAEAEGEDLKQYEPLYKAVVTGDWKSCEEFLERKPEALSAKITDDLETPLIVAVRSAARNHVVKNLVERMSPEQLAMTKDSQSTALDIAAMAGNLGAAKLLVEKNPNLPNIYDKDGFPPIFHAAYHGYRDMTAYLIDVTRKDFEFQPFLGQKGAALVEGLIKFGQFDIALPLVKRYKLACEEPSALEAMAARPFAFYTGTRFNWWQRFIYTHAPSKHEDSTVSTYHKIRGDIENPVFDSFISVKQKLVLLFWKVTRILVPQAKQILEKKLMHSGALELLKHVCEEIAKLDKSRAPKKIMRPLKTAIEVGNYEVVEDILASFPGTIHQEKISLYKMFHLAILNRKEKVFNLIYQFPEDWGSYYLSQQDESGNNGLHLAGCLQNAQMLKLRIDAAGAALQMQRELQWFQEVEKLMGTEMPHVENKEKKTPKMVFTETHQDLVKEGERWMKDTANSCTIVVALIVTIMFAATITIPGGNRGDSGLPNFSKNRIFKVFGFSDALALFTSTSSVLMFLSILTSRYAEYDFLLVLPRKLIFGLLTLFVSIISMMIAFGAAFSLMFGDQKIWILVPVFLFSCIPVTLFASFQFPLLLELIKSTYFPRIFHKQGDRMLM